MSESVPLSMRPHDGSINISETALLIIDMQRDFLQPGGFGELLGNDVSLLQVAVEPIRKVLAAARQDTSRMLILHTREGHRGDMADVHEHKNWKPNPDGQYSRTIGEIGPMGRILIRGQPGHDIIEELYPLPGEPVIDKPGKGTFYGTDLDVILSAQKITTLLVCGVTTEVCVHTTVREANDRGYHCIVIGDCCASYNPKFHDVALEMITAQNGIFGSLTTSTEVIAALTTSTTSTTTTIEEKKSIE